MTLTAPKTHIALIGHGLVGKATLNLLFSASAALSSSFEIVGIANSKCMVLLKPAQKMADPYLGPLNDHADAMPKDLEALVKHLKQFPNPTIIDCTANDSIPAMYPHWLTLNVHVVTPNKRGFAGPLQLWTDIHNAARVPTGLANNNNAGLVFHESTVGAGLPILSTVNDLVDSGDSVFVIEGVFSGTLSYLFNQYSDTASIANQVTFSEIVAKAKDLGYTEPDPRDDLNGMDVARKLIILARQVGMAKISPDSSALKVESLVPAPLQNPRLSIADFMAGLKAHDQEFDARRKSASANKSVLRYVGRIDCAKETASVGLEACTSDHPLSGLRGADNLVRIVTKRFPNGIVIQGAGAGDDVTAFGIVSDLLRVHRMSA